MATLLDLVPKPQSFTSPTAIVLPASPTFGPYGQYDPQEPHHDQEEYSYSDLRALVLSFRKILVERLGVKQGDVIAVSMTNTLEFIIAFLGTTVARAVSAPLNPAYSIPEFQFYLKDTKPILLLIPQIKPSPSGPINKAAQTALDAAKKENVPVYEMWLGDAGLQTKQIFGKQRSRQRRTVQEVGDPQPDDVALVLHTSGTTGRPKSVPLCHRNLMRTTKNIIATYSLTTVDRTYLVMPLFHVHVSDGHSYHPYNTSYDQTWSKIGLLCAFLSPLAARSSITLPRGGKFSVSVFWHDFVSTRCNWYTAVPTIHSILLNAVKNGKPEEAGPFRNGYQGYVPKIRFIRSCSSALAPSTLHMLEKTFKAPVLEAYAMTEAAHQMTSNVAGKRTPGTVGIPVGTQVSIRSDDGSPISLGSVGEVCVRGENVFNGYWENPKANAESFWPATNEEESSSSADFKGRKWFRTGDQGLILKDGEGKGSIKLTGRIKELINRGGEKISPLEVDHALLSVEGVKEAVCFGVEDQKYGEVVWAGIVLDGQREGGSQDVERIKKALETKISRFKIPERILFTKVIPKTATGKIQRRFVRDEFIKQVRKQNGSKL